MLPVIRERDVARAEAQRLDAGWKTAARERDAAKDRASDLYAEVERLRERAIRAEQQAWELRYGIRGALETDLPPVARRELESALARTPITSDGITEGKVSQ